VKPPRAVPLILLLAAGCTSPAAPGPAPVDPLAIRCGESVDQVAEVPEGYEAVLGVVALPAGRVLNAGDAEPGRLFAKQGLLVRADAVFELVVPTGSGMEIGWGAPGPRGALLRVPGCPGGPGWLVFAGGFHVGEPGEFPLTVRADGREAQVRITIARQR